MKRRCKNPRAEEYHNYGGRGITYDARWESVENFYADMGECPFGMQIDRIDNDGNYCKANCRWVTARTNMNNKRTNVIVEFKGQKLTVAELARKVGLPHHGVYKRIRRGWTAEEAVTRPFVKGANQHTPRLSDV